MSEVPARVAIVRLSALGDVVQTLPLASALKRARPDLHLTWVAQPEARTLLDGHPAIDAVRTVPRRSGPLAFLRGLKRLRRDVEVDLVLDPQGNAKSAAVSRAIRASRRLGVRIGDAREWLNRLGHGRCVPRYEPRVHVVERYLSFARHLGVADLSIDFGLTPAPEERAAAEARLEAAGVGADERVAAIQVGRPGDIRHWAPERYAELADALAMRHDYAAIVVTGGPAEVDATRALTAGAKSARVIDTGGETSLRELLALYAVLAGRPGAALISGDTAPVHLASAVGLRTVGLYGSQPAWRTGPLAPRSQIISREGELPCAPCRKRRCFLTSEPLACLARIEVEEVTRAVAEPVID